MTGKTVLVTGATQGIGRATAFGLARLGAKVAVVGRDVRRTQETANAIRKECGDTAAVLMVADLSVQAEVSRLADEFLATHDRLDVLINNAGSIFGEFVKTQDGIERTWALNHLAYVLLTLKLLRLLKKSAPARIINVASHMHASGVIRFDDLNGDQGYAPLAAYRQSKLANILFTKALARRLDGQVLGVNALHPGAVATGMGRDMTPLMRWVNRLLQCFFISPEKGARTSIYLASSPQAAGITGRYFIRCRPANPARQCQDEALQERLWRVSLQQVADFSGWDVTTHDFPFASDGGP